MHFNYHITVIKTSTYISGVLDLFFPLKNSGRARRSMAWTLGERSRDTMMNQSQRPSEWFTPHTTLSSRCWNPVLPIVVEPGGVARDDDVMSLLGHVVLVEVGAFHWFPLHARRALLLLLPGHKHCAQDKTQALLNSSPKHFAGHFQENRSTMTDKHILSSPPWFGDVSFSTVVPWILYISPDCPHVYPVMSCWGAGYGYSLLITDGLNHLYFLTFSHTQRSSSAQVFVGHLIIFIIHTMWKMYH